MVDVKKRPSKSLKLIAILLVLVVLGAAAAYIWQQNNKEESTQEAALQAETKYLVITDWGVKFPLTEDSQDAGYSNRIASPIARALNARFLNTETGCTDEPAAIIYRVPVGDINPQAKGKKYTESETGKTIDEFFYFVRNGPQTCTGNSESQARLDKVRAHFLGIVPSIENN